MLLEESCQVAVFSLKNRVLTFDSIKRIQLRIELSLPDHRDCYHPAVNYRQIDRADQDQAT